MSLAAGDQPLPSASNPIGARAAGSDGSLPTGEPTARVSGWFIFVYTFTFFGHYLVVLMPGLFSLAYKIQLIEPENKGALLGLVAGIGAVVNIVALPVTGILSDRTRSRWGRRRPWLVAGIGVGLAGGLVIALGSSIPVVIAGWMVASAGSACVQAAIGPVIAERIPESQRGKVGAFAGVSAQLAGVGATLAGGALTGSLVLMFVLPVVVLAIGAIFFLLTVPDQSAPAAVDDGQRIGAAFRELLFNPREHRDFGLVVLGKFLLQVGMTLFSTYQLYFVLDRLGFTPEEAGQRLALVGGIGILVTTACAILSGILSDRWKRRRGFIYVAAGLVATGLATMAFAHGFVLYASGALFILAGAGMFGSVDLALMGDVLPEKDTSAGRWMSIYNVAATLPTALAPVIAPAILLIGSPKADNYTALYIFAAAIGLGTTLTTSMIRSVR
jgi:MFS family permease